MDSSEYSKNNIKNFIIKKNKMIPKFLYKYKEINNRSLNILKDDLIWFSTVKRFEDENEGNIENIIHPIIISVNPIEKEIYRKFKPHGQISSEFKYGESEAILTAELAVNGLKNSLVCSLCETSKSDCMWEEYGNNNQGICIEYKIKGKEKYILCKTNIYKVEYKYDKLKKPNIYHQIPLLNQLLIKEPSYSPEKEWRVISNNLSAVKYIDPYKNKEFEISENGGCYHKFPKPESVILGKNITNNNEKKIREICDSRKIKIKKQ